MMSRYNNKFNRYLCAVVLAVTVLLTAVGYVNKGTFTDSRDLKTYRTVKIGSQTWMAENLNYDTADRKGSWCFGNRPDSCARYGRLYDWNTAMKACPAGWHLPNRVEWDNLLKAAGGLREQDDDGSIDWKNAGAKLKSKSVWWSNGNGNHGVDKFGFSALPGGYRYAVYGSPYSTGGCTNEGVYGYWWSASEYNADSAWHRYMHYGHKIVWEHRNNKDNGLSVRCLKN